MIKKALISSISSDSHTWNLVFMQLLLEERGIEVINIGNCVPGSELIQACHHHRPDLLLISSVNGHAHIEGMDIITAIKHHDMLRSMKVVIGGKLGIAGKENNQYVAKLLDAGFDQVFSGDDAVLQFEEYLDEEKKILIEVNA